LKGRGKQRPQVGLTHTTNEQTQRPGKKKKDRGTSSKPNMLVTENPKGRANADTRNDPIKKGVCNATLQVNDVNGWRGGETRACTRARESRAQKAGGQQQYKTRRATIKVGGVGRKGGGTKHTISGYKQKLPLAQLCQMKRGPGNNKDPKGRVRHLPGGQTYCGPARGPRRRVQVSQVGDGKKKKGEKVQLTSKAAFLGNSQENNTVEGTCTSQLPGKRHIN